MGASSPGKCRSPQTAPRLWRPYLGSIEPSRSPEVVLDAFRASLTGPKSCLLQLRPCVHKFQRAAGCLHPHQYPPQSSFPSHNPFTPAPSYSTSRHNVTSPPTTIIRCRAYSPPPSAVDPKRFSFLPPETPTSAPSEVALPLLPQSPPSPAAPVALFQPTAQASAVARPCYACFGYVSACISLVRFRCQTLAC